MKLLVNLIRTQVESCEIEVDSLSEAKKEIESLFRDDFSEKTSYYSLEILQEDGEEVTAVVQPYTPNLG